MLVQHWETDGDKILVQKLLREGEALNCFQRSLDLASLKGDQGLGSFSLGAERSARKADNKTALNKN